MAQHLPAFAKSTIQEIYQAVLTLRTIPYRGRIEREQGTRELVLPPKKRPNSCRQTWLCWTNFIE